MGKMIQTIFLLALCTTVIKANYQECKTDDECNYLYYCWEGKECMHKPVFPLEFIEKIGSFVVLLMAGLFMSGGLGGGAMMVPLLIVFFRFDSKEAIYNSYAIIFGGSIGNFLVSVREVDYDTLKP